MAQVVMKSIILHNAYVWKETREQVVVLSETRPPPTRRWQVQGLCQRTLVTLRAVG